MTTPIEPIGAKDRFHGDSQEFIALVEPWDKIPFAAHSPQMVPLEVLKAAREAVKGAARPLASVASEATECVRTLAPLQRTETSLGAFKDCLIRATR